MGGGALQIEGYGAAYAAGGDPLGALQIGGFGAAYAAGGDLQVEGQFAFAFNNYL